MQKKKITTRFMVSINGKYVPLDSLPEEQRKQIITELNDRALRAIGYVPEREARAPTA
ncbi:MAG: hypothetical protein K2N94_05370 [Lachnospiraceae bacterium]|nr:hypothetical protein [Lachnospiraceae bacterium]